VERPGPQTRSGNRSRRFEAGSLKAFSFLGLRLDEQLNASSPLDTDIAATDSRVRVVIVRGDENWQIAAEAFQASQSPGG